MSCAPHGASLPSDILKFVPFWELKSVSAGRVVGRAPRAAHWGPGPLAVLSSFRPLETFAREKCQMGAPEGRAPLRQLPAPFVTWKELPVPWTHTHSFTGDLGLPPASATLPCTQSRVTPIQRGPPVPPAVPARTDCPATAFSSLVQAHPAAHWVNSWSWSQELVHKP